MYKFCLKKQIQKYFFLSGNSVLQNQDFLLFSNSVHRIFIEYLNILIPNSTAVFFCHYGSFGNRQQIYVVVV